MTTNDHPGDGTASGGQHERHRPGHTHPEGEYQDRDVEPGYRSVDAGADRGADGGADYVADRGADAGADRGADAGADGGADVGAGYGADGGADYGADRGADAAADRDVEPVGSYVDADVGPTEQLRPADEGEFTDTDVVDEHRHVHEEGSYTDADPEPHRHGGSSAPEAPPYDTERND
ncbi:MAG: hypothetical protein ACJ73E_16940 [Mycobacteriales bacterium]